MKRSLRHTRPRAVSKLRSHLLRGLIVLRELSVVLRLSSSKPKHMKMMKKAVETGVEHLLEASVKLDCSLETTARALILYHHFMRCVDEGQYDESMIAGVALNLSGRINEQIIDIDSLICVFCSIVNGTTEVLNSEDYDFALIKKTLKTLDFQMQRMLEFNLNHRLAHQYLVPFLALIFERSRNIAEFRKELSLTCIRLVSDFYTTRNCLNFKPEHIAIACIDLTFYIHGMVNDLVMIPVWYQGFCTDLTVDKVKQIKRDMIRLYQDDILPPSIDSVKEDTSTPTKSTS